MTSIGTALDHAFGFVLADVPAEDREEARNELRDLLAFVLAALPIPSADVERTRLRAAALDAIAAAPPSARVA